MLPSYIEDGAASLLYFLPAVVLFLFVLLNLLLASVYNGYTLDRSEDMVDSHARRCVFLTMAFPLVAENQQTISFERFGAFVRHYRAVENQFSLLDMGAPQSEEINRLWSELRPSHNNGEASISPAECECAQKEMLLPRL